MSPSNGTADRVYYMDLARGAILVAGVFFHAAFIFCNPEWLVVSPWHSESLWNFVSFVRQFRMETLFVVSGFFSAVLVTRKGTKGFVANRMVRMGMPLLFCGLLFNGAAVLIIDHPRIPWSDLHHYTSGEWMLHLWNVGNLLGYEATMFSLLWFFPSLHAGFARLKVPVPLVVVAYPVAVFAAGWIWFRIPHFPGATVIFDTSALAGYVPAYLLGYLVHQNRELREKLFDWRWTIPMAFLILAGWEAAIHLRPGLAESKAIKFVTPLQHLSWTLVLFSLVKRFEIRNIWVKRLAIASYSIYILHMPLQIALFRYVPALREGWHAFILLSVVPIAAVWLFHVQVIERWKWAGFLFNGKIYDAKTRSF